jgi:hypothetical protein
MGKRTIQYHNLQVHIMKFICRQNFNFILDLCCASLVEASYSTFTIALRVIEGNGSKETQCLRVQLGHPVTG